VDQSSTNRELQNLTQLLERLKHNIDPGDHVSVGTMLEAIGRRSFGPILLFCGLLPASPLSGIPGLPSVIALLVLIVIIQLLTGHHHFWLPEWLLRRTVPKDKFCKALDFLQKPAHWVDRLLHPRLEYLTEGPAVYIIALICAIIALIMPPLELVPFANTSSGIALSIFGLALISHDGLLALLGFIIFIASLILGASALF
jgi:hypothetical protein